MTKRKRETLLEREKRESRQGATIILIGVGVFALFIVVMGGVLAIFNALESSAVVNLYGETVASACETTPIGTASAENLPQDAPPRPLLLLTTNSQRRHAWHADLPAAWRAEDESSVVLVGCVSEDYVELETCTYSRQADAGDTYQVNIRREQHTATMTLVNPATGQRIDELTLMGAMPAACPADTDGLTSGRQRGDDLTLADFATWAEGYVLE